MTDDLEPPVAPDRCPECGWIDGSFACKIRHVGVNVANLKRDREGGR